MSKQTEKTNRSAAAARRRPLAGQVPRPIKRESGRTEATETPAHIRVTGVQLSDDERTYIRRKLGMRLGKYATSIERVSVRVADVNGPRGGVDQLCRIKAVLSGLPSIVAERRHTLVRVAFDEALRAAQRGVQRAVSRRRLKPRQGRMVRGAAAGRVPV